MGRTVGGPELDQGWVEPARRAACGERAPRRLAGDYPVETSRWNVLNPTVSGPLSETATHTVVGAATVS